MALVFKGLAAKAPIPGTYVVGGETNTIPYNFSYDATNRVHSASQVRPLQNSDNSDTALGMPLLKCGYIFPSFVGESIEPTYKSLDTGLPTVLKFLTMKSVFSINGQRINFCIS